MTDNNKTLTILAKQIVQQKIAGCKDCDGSGIADCKGKFAGPGCPPCKEGCPCPTCADLRKLERVLTWQDDCCEVCRYMQVAGSCNNSDSDSYTLAPNSDGICGHYERDDIYNPTYTAQSLHRLLEGMGEWKGFEDWHDEQAVGQIKAGGGYYTGMSYYIYAHTAILTSDTVMVQVVIGYFKERLK